MKLYVVECGWEYEGFYIDSIWDTREKAKKREKELWILKEKDKEFFDFTSIEFKKLNKIEKEEINNGKF